MVRRAISAGSTAIISPEETIRRLVSEFNLPREVATYLLVQASSSKDELLRVVGQEVRRFLETVNVSGELQKLLTSLSFEIKTEIRFIPKRCRRKARREKQSHRQARQRRQQRSLNQSLQSWSGVAVTRSKFLPCRRLLDKNATHRARH